MGFSDYIKQDNSGNIIVAINNLPSNAFIDAIKVRDLAEVRILDRKINNIEPGGKDVKLRSLTGETSMLSRKELIERYKTIRGKSVTLAFFRHEKNYLVESTCKEPYKVMKLPSNCIGNFGGKRVEPGSYIVCKTDESGNTTVGIISPSRFRQMFKIPMQDVIKRNMNGNKNKNFTLFNKPKQFRKKPNILAKQPAAPQITVAQQKPVLNPSMLRKQPVTSQITQTNRQFTVDNSKFKSINTPTTNYRFRITRRIVSVRNTKQLLGYEIQEIQTGRVKSFQLNRVMKMCEMQLVENAMIVTHTNGMKYLRGNGIVLDNLPKILA